jgi:hypothetical protein
MEAETGLTDLEGTILRTSLRSQVRERLVRGNVQVMTVIIMALVP